MTGTGEQDVSMSRCLLSMVSRVPILSHWALYDSYTPERVKLSARSANFVQLLTGVQSGHAISLLQRQRIGAFRQTYAATSPSRPCGRQDMSNSDLRSRHAKPREQRMAIASAEKVSVSRLMERPCKAETPQQARMHTYRDDNNIASTIAEKLWHTSIPVLVSLVTHTCRLSSWHDIVSSMSHDK